MRRGSSDELAWTENGGIWIHVASQVDCWLQVNASEEAELVAFDRTARTVLGRSQAGKSLLLRAVNANDLLIAFRPLSLSSEQKHSVAVIAGRDPILAGATQGDPHHWDRSWSKVDIVAEGEDSEFWIELPLAAGEYATLETGPATRDLGTDTGQDEARNIDTVLSLLDKETGVQLASDDDSGRGSYSKLRYDTQSDITVLINISNLNSTFNVGSAFTLNIDTVSRPSISYAIGPIARDEPHVLDEVWRTLTFHSGGSGGEAWLGRSLVAGQKLIVETWPAAAAETERSIDTVINLYDAATMMPLGANDDGGMGVFSRLEHAALFPLDVLIGIQQIGDQPFASGETFNISIQTTEFDTPPPVQLDGATQELVFSASERGSFGIYRGSLRRGQRLIVETAALNELSANESFLEDAVDTVLTLYDSAGEKLTENDDFDTPFSKLEYLAVFNHDFEIRVAQYPDKPFEPETRFRVRYDYQAIDLPKPEPLSGEAEEIPYTADERLSEAWYEIDLVEGQSVTIETAQSDPGTPDLDTRLVLYDAETGKELGTNDNDGERDGYYSRVQYVATGATKLVVRATTHDQQSFETGDAFIISFSYD